MEQVPDPTAMSADAHFKSLHKGIFVILLPPNTLAYMPAGIHGTHRNPRSEPRPRVNMETSHPRDHFTVYTTGGRTSDSRDVACEVEGMPIIAAAPQAETGTVPSS